MMYYSIKVNGGTVKRESMFSYGEFNVAIL